MIRLEGRRSRILLRHLIEVAFGAVFIGLAMTLFVCLWPRGPGMAIGAAIGIPVAGHSIGGLLRAALHVGANDPPVLSWDQDGLTYLSGNMDDDVQLRWTAVQGYRSTWEYPPRLKIRRSEGRPCKIDLFPFSADDRARLLTELAVRSRTLPELS